MRRSLFPALCALLICGSVVRAFEDPACPACAAHETGQYLGQLAQQVATHIYGRFGLSDRTSQSGTPVTYQPIDPDQLDRAAANLHVYDPLSVVRTPPQPLQGINTGWRPRQAAEGVSIHKPGSSDPSAPFVVRLKDGHIHWVQGNPEDLFSHPERQFSFEKLKPGTDSTSDAEVQSLPAPRVIRFQGKDGLERIGVDFDFEVANSDCAAAGECPQSGQCVPLLSKIPHLNRLFKNSHAGVTGSVVIQSCGSGEAACTESGKCQACSECCASCECDGDCCTSAIDAQAEHLEQAAAHLAAAGLKDEAQATRLKALQFQIDHLKSLVSQQAEQTSALKRENVELRERFARLEKQTESSSTAAGQAKGTEVLGFSADWCGPCQAMLPTFEKLRQRGVSLRVIDCDAQQDLAEQFNVTSIPTVIVIQDGKVVSTRVGVMSEAALKQLIENRTSRMESKSDVEPTSGEAAIPRTLPSPQYLQEDIQYFPQTPAGEVLPKWDGLTNADVNHWLEQGVSEEAIIDAIRQRPTRFSLSPAAIDRLRNAGATDTLVQHMRKGKLRELLGH